MQWKDISIRLYMYWRRKNNENKNKHIKGSNSHTLTRVATKQFQYILTFTIFWFEYYSPATLSLAFCFFLNALLKMHFCNTFWKHPQWLKHSAWEKKCIASAKLFESAGWFGSIAKITCSLRIVSLSVCVCLWVCAYNKTLNCSINFMKLFVSAPPIFIPKLSCVLVYTWKFICRNPVYIVLHLLVSRCIHCSVMFVV